MDETQEVSYSVIIQRYFLLFSGIFPTLEDKFSEFRRWFLSSFNEIADITN